MISSSWVSIGYLISASLFILGLKKLGHPRTAPVGNQLGAMGMLVAVLTTVTDMYLMGGAHWELIISGIIVGSVIGYIMAIKVEMTGMPELVALFNGFGGAASALVALSESWKYIEDETLTLPSGLELEVLMVAAGLSALVGWMTLTGSILAMFKLKGGIEIRGKEDIENPPFLFGCNTIQHKSLWKDVGGYDESLLNGFNAEFAMPDKLLDLSRESDTVLCY